MSSPVKTACGRSCAVRQTGQGPRLTCDGVLHDQADAGAEQNLVAVELSVARVDAHSASSAVTHVLLMTHACTAARRRRP